MIAVVLVLTGLVSLVVVRVHRRAYRRGFYEGVDIGKRVERSRQAGWLE